MLTRKNCTERFSPVVLHSIVLFKGEKERGGEREREAERERRRECVSKRERGNEGLGGKIM
jgi:hypothetical protein